MFQHTAARRRLGTVFKIFAFCEHGFNTQPPEGGWVNLFLYYHTTTGFNTQPPEGGWIQPTLFHADRHNVSTHSRPKAAGQAYLSCTYLHTCFNTQPPEGGWVVVVEAQAVVVSTHSRPKAAGKEPLPVGAHLTGFNTQPPEGGWDSKAIPTEVTTGFNTQPPEGGWFSDLFRIILCRTFQHTAARRRLDGF